MACPPQALAPLAGRAVRGTTDSACLGTGRVRAWGVAGSKAEPAPGRPVRQPSSRCGRATRCVLTTGLRGRAVSSLPGAGREPGGPAAGAGGQREGSAETH